MLLWSNNKRPYIEHRFISMNTGELHEYLVNEIVEFILDRADINTIEDIENFWDHYFDEHYMSNSVWEAKAVINGEWTDINEFILKESNRIYTLFDDINKN